jgi:hypothetical protein
MIEMSFPVDTRCKGAPSLRDGVRWGNLGIGITEAVCLKRCLKYDCPYVVYKPATQACSEFDTCIEYNQSGFKNFEKVFGQVTTTAAATTTLLTLATTVQPAGRQGLCIGDAAHCKGEIQSACGELAKQKIGCQWEWRSGIIGTCIGNHSSCGGSGAARCFRSASRGVGCVWESAALLHGSAGACVGQDFTCVGISEELCMRSVSGGATCKWRKSFQISGSMQLDVADPIAFQASSFAKEGVIQAIANVTGVPAMYIDIDIATGDRRLLQTRQLATSTLTVMYVIAVPGDAPKSVALVAVEVVELLSTAASSADMPHIISAKITEQQIQAGDTADFDVFGVTNMQQPHIEEATITTTTTTTQTLPIASTLRYSAISGAWRGHSSGGLDSGRKIELCIDDGTTSIATEMTEDSMQVTCCDQNGQGSRPGCVQGVSWDTAKSTCQSNGLTLCTVDQLKSGSGEATGCNGDQRMTWAADSCQATTSTQVAATTSTQAPCQDYWRMR